MHLDMSLLPDVSEEWATSPKRPRRPMLLVMLSGPAVVTKKVLRLMRLGMKGSGAEVKPSMLLEPSKPSAKIPISVGMIAIVAAECFAGSVWARTSGGVDSMPWHSYVPSQTRATPLTIVEMFPTTCLRHGKQCDIQATMPVWGVVATRPGNPGLLTLAALTTSREAPVKVVVAEHPARLLKDRKQTATMMLASAVHGPAEHLPPGLKQISTVQRHCA